MMSKFYYPWNEKLAEGFKWISVIYHINEIKKNDMLISNGVEL